MGTSDRIRRARERKGLSQSDLARAVGVRPQAVQQWEREDGTAPKRTRLENVARVLGVSVAHLLSEDAAAPEPSAAIEDREAELLATWRELPEGFRQLIEYKARDLLRYWRTFPPHVRVETPMSDTYLEYERTVQADMAARLGALRAQDKRTKALATPRTEREHTGSRRHRKEGKQ